MGDILSEIVVSPLKLDLRILFIEINGETRPQPGSEVIICASGKTDPVLLIDLESWLRGISRFLIMNLLLHITLRPFLDRLGDAETDSCLLET